MLFVGSSLEADLKKKPVSNHITKNSITSLKQPYLLDIKDFQKGSKHHTFQGAVYNFLERPTGWKCFIYHFSV